METYLTVTLTIASYLAGSLSFSYILAKEAAGTDIRKVELKIEGFIN